MDLATLKTDSAKEVEGVWQELQPAKDDQPASRVKVARWGNKAMAAALKKANKKYRTMVRRDQMPDDLNDSVMREIVADTVFLAFDGPWTDQGKPLTDTRATRMAMLAVPDFYAIIAGLADDMAAYKEEADADTVGNSQPESTTTFEP